MGARSQCPGRHRYSNQTGASAGFENKAEPWPSYYWGGSVEPMRCSTLVAAGNILGGHRQNKTSSSHMKGQRDHLYLVTQLPYCPETGGVESTMSSCRGDPLSILSQKFELSFFFNTSLRRWTPLSPHLLYSLL